MKKRWRAPLLPDRGCEKKCLRELCAFWKGSGCGRERLRDRSAIPKPGDVFLAAVAEGAA